ncbi:pseudoazurin [Frigidibacter sp. ROC022]|uniref:pseudoazurin n=1 Tax=Frigidibacter sp. ROC022 TaxID=2971796 RepID=UPI00215B095A|nr:pseudoazurin [Frigidibacter sp. ROC022]MCR8726115.1 pseudoazurin [Frigidibacter sp. ROC022]
MKLGTLAIAATLVGFLGQAAAAEEFEVRMLNKGEKGSMVFEPDLVRAQVGDTVKFIPVDKGHDAQSIKGMIPDGAEMFAGKTNQEITVTLDVEGVYGVRCKPHYGLGMVMLIVAGEPVNLEAVEAVKTPKKAAKVFQELFDEIAAE